jgi:hypothetical protein
MSPPFDIDVRDADYRQKGIQMKVIKFEEVIDCIDAAVCSEPWRFTDDPLDADDPKLDSKVAACGAALREALRPLADDFQRLTVEQLQRELWKHEGMVEALRDAIDRAENPQPTQAEQRAEGAAQP